MMSKFSWKYYLEPTPKNVKRLGIAFQALSASVTVGSAIAEYKGLTIGAAVAGLIGSFIVEFFKEERVGKVPQ